MRGGTDKLIWRRTSTSRSGKEKSLYRKGGGVASVKQGGEGRCIIEIRD